jgi:hypothetical protein
MIVADQEPIYRTVTLIPTRSMLVEPKSPGDEKRAAGERRPPAFQGSDWRLVLGDAWVYLLAPGGDATLDVKGVLKTGLLKELYGPGAAAAGLAVDR